MSDAKNKLIADNINALARWYGFKIKDIESEAGVSPGYLSRLAKSNNDSSSIFNLLLVSADKFHVSIDSLVSMNFQKLANPEKKRLHLFLENVLYLSNRGQLSWEKNNSNIINDELITASFFCSYDKDIIFYVCKTEESQKSNYPSYSFFSSNKGVISAIAKINLPGPTLYETLRQLFETAASQTEFVEIDEDADYAIRKFMAENKTNTESLSEQQKYKALYQYLKQSKENSIILTFYQIEEILGFPLPASAWNHYSFWENTNTSNHHHCKSWLDAGFKTVNVSKNTIEHIVHFLRS